MSEIHSDPLDLASDLSQRERDAGLAAIRAGMKPISASLVCLQCGADTKNGARWCDSDCRNDWEKAEARK